MQNTERILTMKVKDFAEKYSMKDHYVSYFPARLDYARAATVDDLIVIHFDTTNYNTKNIEYFAICGR